MKKLFFRYTTGFIPFIALVSCAYAQSSKFSKDLSPSSKEVAYNNPSATRVGATTVSISTKAVKDFTKNFKKAGNAGWFVIPDGYVAEFNQDEIKTKVYYDRKGRWIGNLRSYLEDKMPRDIRHRVKSHYYDYTIYYVQEVTVADKIAYLVKIADKTSWKTIRILDGEMDEIESFEKSK
jgi:hypothetical protein